MTKQKSVIAAQGASVTSSPVSIETLMAQFAQMQALMQTLVPAVNEQVTSAQIEAVHPKKHKNEVKTKGELRENLQDTFKASARAKMSGDLEARQDILGMAKAIQKEIVKAPTTRKEAIAAWKQAKEKKATETPTQAQIFQVSERGCLLVGNMKELEIIRTTQGLEKYLTHVKRKSVNGKVFDGYSFSIVRVEMIKKAFAIK